MKQEACSKSEIEIILTACKNMFTLFTISLCFLLAYLEEEKNRMQKKKKSHG